jgi:hypothetical protein
VEQRLAFAFEADQEDRVRQVKARAYNCSLKIGLAAPSDHDTGGCLIVAHRDALSVDAHPHTQGSQVINRLGSIAA